MRRETLRLLALIAPSWRWIALAVVLGLATIGSGVGLMATSAYLLSLAALHPSIAELQVAIVGVRFFGISRGLFRYLERYVSHQVTFRLLARLRVWFYRRLEPLAPARLMERHTGDLLSRAISDIETLEHFYIRVIGPSLVAVIAGAAVTLVLAARSQSLGLAVLLALLAAGVAGPWLTLRLGRRPGQRLVAGRGELNARLVDTVQGAADLLAFGRAAACRERIRELSLRHERDQARMAGIRGFGAALTGLSADLAVLAVLALSIPLVRSEALHGVSLAVLALGVLAAFEAVAPLPQAYQQLEAGLASAHRLFEIGDTAPAVSDTAGQALTPRDFSLEVRDLRFRYPAEPGPAVLEGVDLSLPQGACVAVVGPSGAGKTTLVHLLLRFWEYSSGSIRLGGHELRSYRAPELRSRIAVVSQHAHLFSGSLRDNLRLARPDASEAEMVRAAEQAQIHAFIDSLPAGYDTWIGEQGLLLSAGERQRLAIARALLQDAPFLVLDEPTANLDPLTERAVLEQVRRLAEGRTTLLVTHRLVALDWVHEIVVLRAGRVAERGRHRGLLEQAGLYRRMYELQRGADSLRLPLPEPC